MKQWRYPGISGRIRLKSSEYSILPDNRFKIKGIVARRSRDYTRGATRVSSVRTSTDLNHVGEGLVSQSESQDINVMKCGLLVSSRLIEILLRERFYPNKQKLGSMTKNQRGDVKNPNNPSNKSAVDNRSNQLNPNNRTTKQGRK